MSSEAASVFEFFLAAWTGYIFMRHVPRYDVLLGVTFVATNKWAFQAIPFGLKGAHEYAQ